MDTMFIPNEGDFRRWIREAVKEILENTPATSTNKAEEEPLQNREKIAGMFRISLVTLHDWMNKGLPFHKQGGRVYFIKKEVLEYARQKKNNHFKIPEKSIADKKFLDQSI